MTHSFPPPHSSDLRDANHLTIDIDPADLYDRYLGQPSWLSQPATLRIDLALVGQLPQHGFQPDTVVAAQMESAGDLSLADGSLALVDEIQDVLLGGQRDRKRVV